ncbi:MAG: prolipoprotein diacylglyceryl transferase [Sedimentisphaerales bacterium]|nr:prolipoprotein diacylglyceryl transferase [Sedimentisphaerales bacterium]
MYPRLGPISFYGVLYLLGIGCHFIVGCYLAGRLKLPRRVWIALGVCYLVGMTLGAKALYDIAQGQFSLGALFSTAHYMQGGLWGGLVAYFVLAIPAAWLLAGSKRLSPNGPQRGPAGYCPVRSLSEPKRKALDLTCLTIPPAWAISKIGCFLNGCCYGSPCSLPWAVSYPETAGSPPAGASVHPTQIYEILLMLVIAIVFWRLPYQRWCGAMLCWFAALYGLGRTLIDFFRGDQRHFFLSEKLPLNLAQLICLSTALAALAALYLHTRPCRGIKTGNE